MTSPIPARSFFRAVRTRSLGVALTVLVASLSASAQTYSVLHDFTGGVDGAFPHQIIQGSDGNFYGTTPRGGANALGNIFEITPSGTFSVLYSFTGGANGCQVEGPVFRDSNGDIYGTTHECGDPKCRCGIFSPEARKRRGYFRPMTSSRSMENSTVLPKAAAATTRA
jgi:uncharacterized repeat protein (TIGR03803 family)